MPLTNSNAMRFTVCAIRESAPRSAFPQVTNQSKDADTFRANRIDYRRCGFH
uniref:Uncharacterized protein n=1 Tax=Candidatus Kentrum sp. SD TaxID=2126332 RepID=A0A450YUM8_9GAMM|nr:MAG: hypothetical protein BECKSD772F_GA0070984_12162 [Candidatus Kentron sp. SD]VFK49412.1 MAG: hypothetical protein BECKSD772E_GA0070983_11775 [Candidatus Kentron sp. SD]VFK80178.1 MAG: hypothetical protein BECKSD772D_GA0070982_109010 [Candidatus Kentron sp. SD]